MATVELPPAELLRKLLRYDADTGYLYWLPRPEEMFPAGNGLQWNGRFAGRRAFTAISGGYYVGAIHYQNYMAHRIIWKMTYGVEPIEVDHINGVRTDNRLSNLRNVTSAENSRNSGRDSRNTSGVTGVYRHFDGRWRARIWVNGRARCLGCFHAFDDAVRARKAAEAEIGFHQNHGSPRKRQGAGKPGQAAR